MIAFWEFVLDLFITWFFWFYIRKPNKGFFLKFLYMLIFCEAYLQIEQFKHSTSSELAAYSMNSV